ERGVPGRRRGAGVSHPAGNRPLRRAGDEDEEGARVLRGHAQERELSSTSSGVASRWEWRTFGEDFGDAEARIGELTTEREQESDDVYILSVASNSSVKVRGGQMDVKKLQAVDDEGLEQWKPVLKAGFPLGAPDVETVLAALGLHEDLEREKHTLEQLLGALP